MDEPEVALVAQHVTLSWPAQVLDPSHVGLWIKDFKNLDVMTMIAAVDKLRNTQDFMPTTHQLIAMHGALWQDLHPKLPVAHVVPELDPRRPYNLAWRLLTETWMTLRAASFRANEDKQALVTSRKLFLAVNKEIQALAAATHDLMPDDPDAVAPAALVAMATAAKERVRLLLFGETATAAQDAAEGTIGHAPTTSPSPSRQSGGA